MLNPLTKEAYDLFHEGTIALSQVEANGIYIDRDYCERQIQYLQRKIDRLGTRLDKTEVFSLWKKKYGSKFKIDSGPQLADILFNKLGYTPTVLTSSGEPSVGQEALTGLGLPMMEDLVKYRKYTKARNTYLINFMKEIGDGEILHPQFHLHKVSTYRSSSSDPNWQNIPSRDAEIKKIIREAIRPRKNHHIVEIDYSGIEVKIAACYHEDPVMLKYIHDPNTDMHRDMAMQCYKLGEDEWTKLARYCAKNMFVFPQFYGDYYKTCAHNLWNAIKRLGLKTAGGICLYKHLASKGIKTQAAFEKHIKKVEDHFWNVRFKVYAKWKKRQIASYEKNGFIDLKTGFRCSGIMRDNQVVNYPVQGAAFHCLLWSLTRVNRILREKGFKTLVIGQIHDSIILDVHTDELDEVLRLCEKVMCHDLRKRYTWINVPIGIEAEVAPVNKTWYYKEEVTEKTCSHCGYSWVWERKDDDGKKYDTCVKCEKNIYEEPTYH